MPKVELFFRSVLNIAVAAAMVSGLGVTITAPLVLAGIVVTAELAVRPYGSNAADKLLLGSGSIVTVLILTGLCLNLTPWGLTTGTWACAWLVISVAILVWRRRWPSNLRVSNLRLISRYWILCLWCLAALAVFFVSGVVAMAGVRAWNQKPVLALSLISESSHAIVIQIDATSTDGSYRVTANSVAHHARPYSSPLIAIEAGTNDQAIRETVPVNVAGRWYVYLNSTSGGAHLREIIVDVRRA